MNQKAIQVQGIVHRYGQVIALDGISFSVEPGEVFGFLGPNGAGKTTTIRILTGQLAPTAGDAWVMGRHVIEDRQALKSRIGVVFETQNLYERLSGRENLQFTARLYGVPAKRADEMLRCVGLAERGSEPLKHYSNGMKQRLLIARAMIHEPEVLFLDEPTRGLDPNIAGDIRALVSGLARQGVTIFLTTHYMEEADRLCDRVAILYRGQIAALDTPENLKASRGNGAVQTLEDVFIHLTGTGLVC